MTFETPPDLAALLHADAQRPMADDDLDDGVWLAVSERTDHPNDLPEAVRDWFVCRWIEWEVLSHGLGPAMQQVRHLLPLAITAWRSMGLHATADAFDALGPRLAQIAARADKLSEDDAAELWDDALDEQDDDMAELCENDDVRIAWVREHREAFIAFAESHL